jgi:hypothetical protein
LSFVTSHDLGAELQALPRGGLKVFLIAGDQRQPHTGHALGEYLRNGRADALRGAGDEDEGRVIGHR